MKLIAVSGGVDSMCLLHILCQEEVSVVHINHNTRGQENIDEENLVREFCNKKQIPFFRYDYTYKGIGNFQKEARAFRYRKFKDLIKQFHFEAVYLAHHFDDQIENILMNPLKIGPKIMQEVEYIEDIKVVRPLLNKSKQDLYKYAKINSVRYLEDSSNNTIKYHRNFVRNELKSYTYDQKMQLFTEEKKRSENILKKINHFKNMNDIDVNKLKNSKIDIYCYLKSKNIKSNISSSKLDLIKRFLSENKNGQIQINKNVILLNSYGVINLMNENEKIISDKKTKVVANKNTIFNNIQFIFQKNGYVRQHKPGDKYKIKNGYKKVSRFFIDQKIPKNLRNIWPILVNENDDILYIPKKDEVKILEEQNGTRSF